MPSDGYIVLRKQKIHSDFMGLNHNGEVVTMVYEYCKTVETYVNEQM